MNNEWVKRKVDSTKFLIERDSLIVPSDMEDEVASLVEKYISRDKKIKIPSLRKSTYDVEMSKVLSELKERFCDEDLIKCYNEEIINKRLICQCTAPHSYYTSFRGPQIPWDINVPVQLDELSHVYIGHEVIHVLSTSGNFQEWQYLLMYSDVLPMLYELIQADNKNESMRNKIIKWRISQLQTMYNNVNNDDILNIIGKDRELLKYYQMPERQYFISFYYTILLYLLYKENPKDILLGISNYLKQKITTKTLLEDLGMLDGVETNLFEKGYYELLLRNR